MNNIRSGAERIIKILGTRPIDGKATYRVSRYSYDYWKGTRCYIKQTLTGQIVELSDEEAALYQTAKENGISGAVLSTSNGNDLVACRILTPENSDELQTYQTIMLILQNAARTEKGIRKYTILPTTACNARCVYCYEEGMPCHTMSYETADQTVGFISRTRQEGPIKLIWFGGEPLAAPAIISRICTGLKERKLPFSSTMITNATLMTEELAKEAIEIWGLTKAQVSVDGLQIDYERRKNYVDPSRHNYETLLLALHRMIDAGIKINLRCNYDRKNFHGLKQFAEDIRTEFGQTDQLNLYFAMLFQEQHSQECVGLHRDMRALQQTLEKEGLMGSLHKKKKIGLRTNHCMADSFGDSIVIDPNGMLYNCEHLPGQKPLGSVTDNPFRYSMPKGWEEPDDSCKKCCFLPECTPFYKNSCPDYFEDCYGVKCIDAEYEIERVISNK